MTSTTRSASALRKRDFRDLDLGERLAMTVEFADALFRLIAEDENLLVLGLAQHRSGDAGAAHGRRSDAHALAAARQHDSVEGDVRSGLAGQQVATNDVAFGDLILLAAGLDDRVHDL